MKIANSKFVVDYDEDADVLYLAKGVPVPAYVDEDDNGLAFRFSMDDEPCGVTVVGFISSHWSDRINELASIVGEKLNLRSTELTAVLNRIHA